MHLVHTLHGVIKQSMTPITYDKYHKCILLYTGPLILKSNWNHSYTVLRYIGAYSSVEPIVTTLRAVSKKNSVLHVPQLQRSKQTGAGIFKKSMGARHREGIGLSYRPARLHRLAEFIPRNRFLGSINVKNKGSESQFLRSSK
jgi:hypothetical protein